MNETVNVEHDRLGRYELLLRMASGGMASLWLARIAGPEQFEKLICVKKVHEHLVEERRFIEMFVDESRIAALIGHPNVATVFDMGHIEGQYFMALEYVHGHNMQELLRFMRRGEDTMDWAYAARMVADAAAGLHAAHELKKPNGDSMGVVHRDVSHQNILLSYDGHVKVVDFGIAYAKERIASTQARTLKGKAAYMSPEQATQQPVDRRSDIFSLGVVLFEALTLRRLFKSGTEVETLLRVRRARVPRPRLIQPDIPVALEKIVLKALALKPSSRFQTAAELQEALDEMLMRQERVVGQAQLSGLMDRYFSGQREEKDRRIGLAVENRPHPEHGALLFSEDDEASLTNVPTASGMSERLERWGWPLAYGGLGVALAVLIVLLLVDRLGGSNNVDAHATVRKAIPSKPKDASGNGMRKRTSTPRTVSLTITVKPDSARAHILFDGTAHPGPVFRAEIIRSQSPETIRVEALGFRPQSLQVVPLQNKNLVITLTREPKRVSPRPPPRRRRRRRRPESMLHWKPLPK
jgi:serine/threonine protein kinase